MSESRKRPAETDAPDQPNAKRAKVDESKEAKEAKIIESKESKDAKEAQAILDLMCTTLTNYSKTMEIIRCLPMEVQSKQLKQLNSVFISFQKLETLETKEEAKASSAAIVASLQAAAALTPENMRAFLAEFKIDYDAAVEKLKSAGIPSDNIASLKEVYLGLKHLKSIQNEHPEDYKEICRALERSPDYKPLFCERFELEEKSDVPFLLRHAAILENSSLTKHLLGKLIQNDRNHYLYWAPEAKESRLYTKISEKIAEVLLTQDSVIKKDFWEEYMPVRIMLHFLEKGSLEWVNKRIKESLAREYIKEHIGKNLIENNKTVLFKTLFEQNFFINCSFLNSFVEDAIKAGNVDIAKLLIGNRCNSKWQHQETAAYSGSLEMVKFTYEFISKDDAAKLKNNLFHKPNSSPAFQLAKELIEKALAPPPPQVLQVNGVHIHASEARQTSQHQKCALL